MSDPDNFLSRWSRRKLEPSNGDGRRAAAGDDANGGSAARRCGLSSARRTGFAQEPTQEPPFDPATLPPIESITAGTDIRDFLKPGVPMSLTRAALRRAWASDPAIRDFIGLAENQWDFTNDSIPGFGPIDPAEVPRLLAKIISSTKDTASAILEGQPEPPQSAPPENAVAKSETGVADDRENVSTDPGNASTSGNGRTIRSRTTLRSATLRIATKKMTRRKTRAPTAN